MATSDGEEARTAMAIGDRRDEEAAGLPDLILVGAPKCGTTSLHAMLALHPDVFIPEYEVFFFDVDDVMIHPDFFFHRSGSSFHDYEGEFEEYLAWYRSLFTSAEPGQIIGEDTTTYLCSHYAPTRIAELLPDVKLIALLRDPVDRAYFSQCPGRTAHRQLRADPPNQSRRPAGTWFLLRAARALPRIPGRRSNAGLVLRGFYGRSHSTTASGLRFHRLGGRATREHRGAT